MLKLPASPPPSFRDAVVEELELRGVRARALQLEGGSRDPARAIVCLAGMGADGRSFLRQRPLANDNFLLLLNLPGETPGRIDPLQFAADAVEEFLDQRKLDRPVLLGSSFGGAVAAQVALRRPAQIRALALVSAVLSRRQIPLASPRFFDLLEAPAPLAHFFSPLAAQIMGGLGLDGEARREIVREGRTFQGHELKRRLLALMDLDLLTPLRTLSMPVLAVHGTQDLLVPWRRGRWVCEAAQHGRFALIPGAGHLPYLSHAAVFNALLADWLQSMVSPKLPEG